MTLRSRRICLRVLSATLFGVAGAIFVSSELGHHRSLLPAENPSKPSLKNLSEPFVAGENEVLDFRSLSDHRLQRPLFDPPPPPPPKVEVTPPPPLTVKLLGTVIDPGNPQAILIDDNQSVSFRTIGQSVSERHPEAIIEKIAADSVTVRRGEEMTTLAIQQ